MWIKALKKLPKTIDITSEREKMMGIRKSVQERIQEIEIDIAIQRAKDEAIKEMIDEETNTVEK